MTAAPLLLECDEALRRGFGHRPVLGRHTLADSGLFDDAALGALIDAFPRERLHALTMGHDPERPDENRAVRHDGIAGAELLDAVREGRLWLNLTRVERAAPPLRALVDCLYAELARALPGFAPDATQATLIVSSPGALVYYHVDGPASVLWHLRGDKRVWTYPALDEHYAGREALEDIFAGTRHEYLPFESAFDAAAQVHDLRPGEWIAWPHNAPHRVTNGNTLNVSLSTEHFTAAGRRRARVWLANRYLRRRWGLAELATRETGVAAALKVFVHRLARVAGGDPRPPKQHQASLRIDRGAPGGLAPLDAEAPA